MDLLVAGMSGPLLHWTREMLAHAAALADQAAVCEPVVADDGWMPPADPAPDRLRLFVTHHPNAFAMTAVGEGRLTALLVVDDPAQALLALLHAGFARDPALRSLSASATVLAEMAASRSALVVTRNPSLSIMSILDRVLTHARVALYPADCERLATRFAPGWLVQQAAPAPADLAPEDAALVSAALAPACRHAVTGRRSAITWPRACLFWGDRPGQPAPRVLQLTGPARVLLYGPYFRLPSGRWTARAIMAFSPDCRGAPLAVELHGSAVFGDCRFVIRQAGVFAVVFAVTIPSALETLEIRVVLQRGAIEGQIGLDRIEFLPQPD